MKYQVSFKCVTWENVYFQDEALSQRAKDLVESGEVTTATELFEHPEMDAEYMNCEVQESYEPVKQGDVITSPTIIVENEDGELQWQK